MEENRIQNNLIYFWHCPWQEVFCGQPSTNKCYKKFGTVTARKCTGN